MIKEIKGYIKKELTIVFYSCRIQLTSIKQKFQIPKIQNSESLHTV